MNIDKTNIDELKGYYACLANILKPDSYSHPYPLDKEVRDVIDTLVLQDADDDYRIFCYQTKIRELWSILLKKSIVCLRYFDTREPFQKKPGKEPHAYGIKDLADYYDRYTDFESTLYGSASYYRDHVMHVFRVWLMGIILLLRDNGKYLELIKICEGYDFNNYEKLSIWTIIALTHDLGYPLEKSSQVIEKTREMMQFFVSNPTMSMDVSFSGVQDSMNDFVLRFISSKMWEIDKETRKTKEYTKEEWQNEMLRRAGLDEKSRTDEQNSLRYVARLQPKYYFKFQKSLEHNQHGILSALIIYKILLYFLESDYSLNEDYMFDYEDSRQFYIRREILRAMASHTCKDIYQNDALTFSFLLIICDDAQEWGRKNISQLYVNDAKNYSFGGVNVDLKDISDISIMDKYEVSKIDYLSSLLERYHAQCKEYRNLFRDGQDTSHRNFNFQRHLGIQSTIVNGLTDYLLTLVITTDEQTRVIVKKVDGSKFKDDDVLQEMLNKIFEKDGGTILNEEEKELKILIG